MPGKLWQRIPDNSGKEQLHEVALDNFEINRPTVIYLSGFLTTNKSLGYVAGSIKQLKSLLEEAKTKTALPDVYSWSHKGLSNLFNLIAYDSFPSKRSSKAGYVLSSALIMPMVAEGFKRNEDGSLEGKPRDREEASKRLRNLTLFGYSAGTVVAQETHNASIKMMKELGYEEKEARSLLKEVVLISTGVVSRPTKETDRFTTINLIASNDRIHRFKNWLVGTVGTALRTVFTDYKWGKNVKRLNIKELSASSIFMTAAASKELKDEEVCKQTGEMKEKKVEPLFPKWALMRSYHELQHYVTVNPKYNGFANVVLSALTNAVHRNQKTEPLKLIEPPTAGKLSSETHDAYKERMQRALEV
jgi:hypothetical protein